MDAERERIESGGDDLAASLGPIVPTPAGPSPSPGSNPPPPTVPAGWYPDPDNHTGFRYGGVPSMRYFDGVQWTDNRAPMQRRQPQHSAPQQPIIVNQQFAPQAAQPIVVYTGGTNHALHLILTILTCGLWLPVWIIVAIINGFK